MLERNILSHIKLALLLTLLGSSLLLNARLVPSSEQAKEASESIAWASVEFATAMVCIAAGAWEYYCGYKDLTNSRAFMIGVRYKPFISESNCTSD